MERGDTVYKPYCDRITPVNFIPKVIKREVLEYNNQTREAKIKANYPNCHSWVDDSDETQWITVNCLYLDEEEAYRHALKKTAKSIEKKYRNKIGRERQRISNIRDKIQELAEERNRKLAELFDDYT